MDLVLSNDEINNLKISGKILSAAILEVFSAVKPGITGKTLNKIAEESIRRQGGKPSFLNYGEKSNPFPATICLSINNEVVHGIPFGKTIKNGDVVSVDMGVEYRGIFTDSAKTAIAGNAIDSHDSDLIRTTKEALLQGIMLATAGGLSGNIGHEIENFVLRHGYSVVRALVGHGIGRAPHQDPPIPNFGPKNSGTRLVPGIAIAIEPMVNSGSGDVITDDDGWTVKTYDGRNSAHFEHTVLITKSKPLIITN